MIREKYGKVGHPSLQYLVLGRVTASHMSRSNACGKVWKVVLAIRPPTSPYPHPRPSAHVLIVKNVVLTSQGHSLRSGTIAI